MKISELPPHWLAQPGKTAANLPTTHCFTLPLEDAARIHALSTIFGQTGQVILQDLLRSAFDTLVELDAKDPDHNSRPRAAKKTA